MPMLNLNEFWTKSVGCLVWLWCWVWLCQDILRSLIRWQKHQVTSDKNVPLLTYLFQCNNRLLWCSPNSLKLHSSDLGLNPNRTMVVFQASTSKNLCYLAISCESCWLWPTRTSKWYQASVTFYFQVNWNYSKIIMKSEKTLQDYRGYK